MPRETGEEPGGASATEDAFGVESVKQWAEVCAETLSLSLPSDLGLGFKVEC